MLYHRFWVTHHRPLLPLERPEAATELLEEEQRAVEAVQPGQRIRERET